MDGLGVGGKGSGPETDGLSKHDRQNLRDRLFRLIRRYDREELVDMVLRENENMRWYQADKIVKMVEKAKNEVHL